MQQSHQPVHAWSAVKSVTVVCAGILVACHKAPLVVDGYPPYRQTELW